MSAIAAPPEPPPGLLEAVGWTSAREGDLEAYRLMLAAANGTMNLVSAASLEEFRHRHFLDSVQLLWFSDPNTRVWADLGSGAGLPGVILAIALKGRPGAHVHLVESIAKKCRFLAGVVRDLALPAEVHNARAETLRLDVEIVTARACAPLRRLLDISRPYLARGARALFLKGENAEAEIAEAHKTWTFAAQTRPSLSDPRGRIIAISELARAPGR